MSPHKPDKCWERDGWMIKCLIRLLFLGRQGLPKVIGKIPLADVIYVPEIVHVELKLHEFHLLRDLRKKHKSSVHPFPIIPCLMQGCGEHRA